jgi:hypothetical protein
MLSAACMYKYMHIYLYTLSVLQTVCQKREKSWGKMKVPGSSWSNCCDAESVVVHRFDDMLCCGDEVIGDGGGNLLALLGLDGRCLSLDAG